MHQLVVKGGSGDSIIQVGEHLAALSRYVPGKRVVLITDNNVWDLYGHAFPDHPVIKIGVGEQIKTIETVQQIYTALLEWEADRSTYIVGIGGGIVCDITGYAASTFMRGVGFGFVATTLLAQVDASVGGKNGVNFKGYKNIVGVFNQPEFVLCDTNLLASLPEQEVACGFAEIVKHGAIGDAALFAYLEANYDRALSLEKEVIDKVVFDSIKLKAAVVNRDEKEQGERKILNFGHTFGHAIEKTMAVPHGVAVSLGMVVAANLSVQRGLLSPDDAERINVLLQHMQLPVALDIDRKSVLDAMRRDKKREGQTIHFVLLDRIGHAVVEPIAIKELEKVVTAL
jgi:3-dehydroquinate synthase